MNPWEMDWGNKTESPPWEMEWTAPVKIGKEAYQDTLKQTLADNPIAAKYAAAGTSLANLWEGGKQLFGKGDQQAIDEQRIIKEANPGSALLGDIALYGATGVAAPVTNTIKGGAAFGGAVGALQPTENENVVQGKLQNAAIGAGAGAVGAKVGQALSSVAANKSAQDAAQASQNATRDATLKEVIDAGYKIPPSYAGGGLTSRLAEGVSGKYKTNQAAQILNQSRTNELAKQYVGLPKDEAFSEAAIQRLKDEQNAVYKTVAELPAIKNPFSGVAGGQKSTESGKQVLNELKDVRFNSKMNWNHFNRTGDPEAYAKAASLDAQAETLEKTLESIAKSNGDDALVKQLQTARTKLSKIHTIDKAMNDATGDVDAVALAKVLNKGGMLTDEARKIARFAQAYGDVARVPKSGDANPFTVLDYTAAALGYGISPAALALPAARLGARASVLSPVVQRAMANKQYGVGPTRKLLDGLLGSPVGITGVAVPQLTQ